MDSVPDIATSADIMLQQMGLPPCGELAVRHAIGNGVDRLVKRLLTGEVDGEPDEALFQQGLRLFGQAYAQHLSERSELYPGVRSALEALEKSGFRLCCVTNKAERFTLPLLERLQLRPFFSMVLSGDSLARKKPDRCHCYIAASHLRIEASNSLMVGDSKHDIAAARHAQMLSVAVPYGYKPR